MAKKTVQRQSKSKSLGQTLNGILIGLILGAIIIAILLWFLNKQKMPTEPQKASEPTQTEIIVPNKAELPQTEPALTASETDTTEGTVGAASEVDNGESQKPVIPKVPVTKPTESKVQSGEKKPQVPTHQEKKPDSKPTEHKTNTKPTPEQILEHGSVEKARAANQKEAAKKQAEKAPASTETQASSGRTVKLQAGSFGSKEQAEAQRAKLALLGISAQVETAQVNGKSVHRVRTARLNENKAAQVRKQLSNNGIDSIAVGAN